MVELEKATKVYTCCGQYIAVTQDCSKNKIKCPRCNKVLTGALRVPSIVVTKKN